MFRLINERTQSANDDEHNFVVSDRVINSTIKKGDMFNKPAARRSANRCTTIAIYKKKNMEAIHVRPKTVPTNT